MSVISVQLPKLFLTVFIALNPSFIPVKTIFGLPLNKLFSSFTSACTISIPSFPVNFNLLICSSKLTFVSALFSNPKFTPVIVISLGLFPSLINDGLVISPKLSVSTKTCIVGVSACIPNIILVSVSFVIRTKLLINLNRSCGLSIAFDVFPPFCPYNLLYIALLIISLL